MPDEIEDMIDEVEEKIEDEEVDDPNDEEAFHHTDFSFGEEDFAKEDKRKLDEQWDKTKKAWKEIADLKGHEVTIDSSKDGKVTWKVVDEVSQDDMRDIRQKEEFCEKKRYPFMQGSRNISASEMFWKLWPSDIDEDVVKINRGVTEINN